MESMSATGRSQDSGIRSHKSVETGNLEEVEVRIVPQFFCP